MSPTSARSTASISPAGTISPATLALPTGQPTESLTLVTATTLASIYWQRRGEYKINLGAVPAPRDSELLGTVDATGTFQPAQAHSTRPDERTLTLAADAVRAENQQSGDGIALLIQAKCKRRAERFFRQLPDLALRVQAGFVPAGAKLLDPLVYSTSEQRSTHASALRALLRQLPPASIAAAINKARRSGQHELAEDLHALAGASQLRLVS